jgi:preprotein translocase subunit YajC
MEGYSMYPALKPGDIAIVRKPESHELVPGILAVVERSSGFVVHRLVKKEQQNFSFLGDALKKCDSVVTETNIIAIVNFVVHNGKQIDLLSNKSLHKARFIIRFHFIYRVLGQTVLRFTRKKRSL